MTAIMEFPETVRPRQVGHDELEDLYRRHRPELVRLAALLVGDEAEEVVQDAFVRAHVAWNRRRDPSRSLSYLRSAVLNGARSRLRRQAVAKRTPWARPGLDLPSEVIAMGNAERRRVVGALRRLPRRQRECVTLRYFVDLPVAEIAATLGISQGSVKTHLHRGVASLAASLEEPDHE